MIKNIGIEMSQNLYDSLRRDNLMLFLATCSEKGIPNMMPITIFYPKNKESILIAIVSDSQGYKNMVWQKRVSLTVIEEEKKIIHIMGRAGVLRAPSHAHPLMHVAQIDIIDITEDDSLLVNVQNEIQWNHSSDEAARLHNTLNKELKECSKII